MQMAREHGRLAVGWWCMSFQGSHEWHWTPVWGGCTCASMWSGMRHEGQHAFVTMISHGFALQAWHGRNQSACMTQRTCSYPSHSSHAPPSPPPPCCTSSQPVRIHNTIAHHTQHHTYRNSTLNINHMHRTGPEGHSKAAILQSGLHPACKGCTSAVT